MFRRFIRVRICICMKISRSMCSTNSDIFICVCVLVSVIHEDNKYIFANEGISSQVIWQHNIVLFGLNGRKSGLEMMTLSDLSNVT